MNNILSNLPKIVDRSKKRRGRGSGSGIGAKSGRGTTRHQAARENIPLHFEGGQGRMVKKYPLLRGKGKNKSVREPATKITLSDLNRFKAGESVDINTLIKASVVPARVKLAGVKVLANGKLTRKLTVILPVSKGAKAAIEALGGTVTDTNEKN